MKRIVSLVLVLVGCAADTGEPSDPINPLGSEERLEIIREPVLMPDVLTEADQPSLIDVEVLENLLIFTYDATPPEIPVGAVLVGELGGSYMRRATAVRALDALRLEISTEPAVLTDVFEDLHIRYRFQPDAADADVVSSADIQDEVAGRRDALGPGTGGASVGGRVRIPGTRIACGVDTGSAQIAPIFELTPTMDAELDIRRERWYSRPRVHFAHFALSGEMRVGVDLQATAAKGIMCAWQAPLDSLGARWTTTIPVGPAPLVLTHQLGPAFEIRGSWVGAQVSGELHAEGTVNLLLGTEKRSVDAPWTNLSDASWSGSASFPDTIDDDRWSVEVTAEGGMVYSLSAYDALGPDFGLLIPLTVSAEGEGGCWEEDITLGAAAQVGVELKVPVFDTTIASASWAWPLIEQQSFDGWPREFGECSEDDCSAHTDCLGCNMANGCGWCGDSCVPDEEEDSCDAEQWLGSVSACQPCEATTCGDCTVSGYCVWCPSLGCVNQSTDEFLMCGEDYSANPHDCAAGLS